MSDVFLRLLQHLAPIISIIINMKYMNRIILSVFLLLPLAGYTQIQIKGFVKDDVAAIGSANVIISSPSGKMIDDAPGAISHQDGTFYCKVKAGQYKIRISFLGYTSWEKVIIAYKDLDLGTIVLKEDTQNLKGITVSAKQKLVTYTTDRIIFNVENSISAIGGNAIAAITAAPGVIIRNNTISMLGKGASRVMVDGHMVQLTGQELFNYLNAIPSADIKSVEVITNPPANYEADGDGGLINIVLKKGLSNSWKNSASLAYDQNKYNFFTLRDNYLYNRNRLKLSFSGGASLGNSGVKQDLKTYYPTGPWQMSYDGKEKKDNISGRMAIDYDLSKKVTIGLQYLGDYTNSGGGDDTRIDIFNISGAMDSLLIKTGYRDQTSVSHTYNAHLVADLDTLNRKLAVDFDYFIYDAKTDNNFIAKTFLPDMEFLNINLAAINIANQNIDNFSSKIGIEHPMKLINLSYGAKFSLTNSEGDISYLNTITGSPVPDANLSNQFSYKEKNEALYLTGTKNVTQKLSLQLGLRLENTQTEGYSGTLNQNIKNDYLKLFPTVYIAYKKSDDDNFILSYGKRINRPGFALLNPFRSYLNSKSYSEGNPFLKPSFSDNFDFSYTDKGKLRTNLFFNLTKDGFGPVFTSDPETNTLIVTRENYYKEYYYGLGENYTAGIFSWWQSQNMAYFLASKSELAGNLNATAKNGAQLYVSTSNTFSLSKNTKLQADYFYSSAFNRGLYQFGNQSGLNMAMKQSFLNNTMQLSIMVNDVLNSAYLKNYTSAVNGIKQVYNENNSSRYFRISMTLNFGNNKINVSQRDFGNDEESKRTH